jgi:CRP/FNR family transcriptional regulator
VAEEVCVLLDGGVKLCTQTPGYRPKVLQLIYPIDYFGLFDTLNDGRRDLSAITMAPSEILLINGHSFREQLERNALFSVQLLSIWGQRFREFSKWCFRYNHLGAREKVAAYLLNQTITDSGRGNKTVNPTRRDIASLLGITPETLSRELSYFKGRGWIRTEKSGGLAVEDAESLSGILPD